MALGAQGTKRVATWVAEHYSEMPKNFKDGVRKGLMNALAGDGALDPASAEQIANSLSPRARTVIYGEATRAAFLSGEDG